MPTSLVQYKFLGNESLVRRGVAKTIIFESPWLRDMPFLELANNNISKYKLETVSAGATAHSVGDTWNAVNPVWEDRDAGLAILGDDADDDKFGSFAASNSEDTMALMIELKSKAVAQLFEKLAVYGRTTSTANLATTNNFKGLLRLIAEAESESTTDLDGWLFSGDNSSANNKQVLMAASGASATLTLAMVDALVDAVTPAPTHIISSKLVRRRLNTLARAAGQNLVHHNDQLGFPVTMYGEQIVAIDEQIRNNMDDSSALVTDIAAYDYDQAINSSAKDTTPIFAVRYGEDGLTGINGVGMIQVERFEQLESKDARRVRIKFYAGMRLTNILAAAVLMNAN